MPGERLAGKVAIVTGAGSRVPGGIGNGRATAVLFARQGARVALVDTVPEWVAETKEIIGREGGQAFVIQADVTDPRACQDVVQQTVDKYEKLDILVNNVGIGGPRGTALQADPHQGDRGMTVHVKTKIRVAKFGIPQIIKSVSSAIVN